MAFNKMIKDISIFVVVAGIGAAIWLILTDWTDSRDAWDSYYLPSTFIASFILGSIMPDRAWRWGIILAIPQFILAIVQESSAYFGLLVMLWMMGMLFYYFVFYALGFSCVSALGGFTRNCLNHFIKTRSTL